MKWLLYKKNSFIFVYSNFGHHIKWQKRASKHTVNYMHFEENYRGVRGAKNLVTYLKKLQHYKSKIPKFLQSWKTLTMYTLNGCSTLITFVSFLSEQTGHIASCLVQLVQHLLYECIPFLAPQVHSLIFLYLCHGA